MRVKELALVWAVIIPSVTLGQNPQLTSCRSLESAGNFIGSDETIVDGRVCKLAKTGAQQSQVIAQQSPTPSPAGATQQATTDGSSVITNVRVIETSFTALPSSRVELL